MKITANKQQFLAAFTAASAAVPSRTPKDILRNVLLSVRGGVVELVATDQEQAVRVTVHGAQCSANGEALLPQRVASILREVSDDMFDMVIDGESLTIKTSSSKFRLTSEDPKEFPPVGEFSDKKFFQVPAPIFRQMIRRTAFATDPQSTRYALAGLLLEIKDGNLFVVATDSRRLAVTKTIVATVGDPAEPSKATIVPTKAMQIMERAIDPQAETVDIAIHDNHVMMRSAGIMVYSRLVEGRFPRWREVIPKATSVTVPLPVGQFFGAVRQSQIVTDEENRGVIFEFNEGQLTLQSSANSVGESKIELPIEYQHKLIKTTFDPKYVADFLKVLAPEQLVELKLVDADTAAVFQMEESYTYLVMPLSNE